MLKKSVCTAMVVYCSALSNLCSAQDDNIFSGTVNSALFKKVNLNFEWIQNTSSTDDGDKYGVTIDKFRILYRAGKISPGLNYCGQFVINNFEYNTIQADKGFCKLDITSFEIYKAEFNSKKYLLITGTNTGSGNNASYVICNLFDITSANNIKYYPLWSKFGGSFCFGDWNNDSKLDFLQIRDYKSPHEIKMVVLSLNKSNFEPLNISNHYNLYSVGGKGVSVIIKKIPYLK